MAVAAAENLREMVWEEIDDLTAIRRDLHAHPELGYAEHRTSGIVQQQLEVVGVQFQAGLAGGTGVLGHIPGGGNGPDVEPSNRHDGAQGHKPRAGRGIALRADMDALPITEQTGAAYASTTPGVMHACGHDGHTAILIGAARVLAKIAHHGPLPRPVTFVFQPAEEGGAGGEKMVRDGCLDGSVLGEPIGMIFGLHGWPELALGQVATRPGPMLAAADTFEITLHGTGSHAAFPHLGRDAIVAGSAIVQALQQIASRNVGPLDSVVVSVTRFHAGTAHNIIPQQAAISGTVRTLLPETQALARQRLANIAAHVAQAHGCAADVTYTEGYPVTSNDPGAVDVFNETARAALGPQRVQAMQHPVMGGEDFSYYGRVVPACFFALGLIPPGQETIPGLHHPAFDFNDAAIETGVEMFCRLALRE